MKMSNNWQHLCNLEWCVICCESESFNLETCVTCGQAFRWRKYDDSSFIGIFSHRVWQLKQDLNSLSFRVLACPHWTFNKGIRKKYKEQVVTTKPECSSRVAEKMNADPLTYWCLRKRKKVSTPAHASLPQPSQPGPSKRAKEQCDEPKVTSMKPHKMNRRCRCHFRERTLIVEYFRLHVDLEELYALWSEKDEKFAKIATKFKGIRLLDQDPAETLISFLCSSNNSISRIVPMIEKMCIKYGSKMLQLDDVAIHDFPSYNRLSQPGVHLGLREIGFGYRASYIEQCARQVEANGGQKWLKSLKKRSYSAAVSELTKLNGVGMKVADCVCLMSLDKLEAVPIDTHVRQIATRDYGCKVNRSLTNKAYEEIGDFYRRLWGSHAGWTQAVMFVAETKPLPHLYAFSGDAQQGTEHVSRKRGRKALQ